MKSKLTECKSCGHQISKSAKACPKCGAKNKKPIYKKWWFWVILVVLIGTIGNAGKDSNATLPNDTTTQVVTPATEQQSATTEAEQNIVATEPPVTIAVEATDPPVEMSMGQKNALASAKSYLSFMAFSYEGLINQLEFEQYSHEDAVFAADN